MRWIVNAMAFFVNYAVDGKQEQMTGQSEEFQIRLNHARQIMAKFDAWIKTHPQDATSPGIKIIYDMGLLLTTDPSPEELTQLHLWAFETAAVHSGIIPEDFKPD